MDARLSVFYISPVRFDAMEKQFFPHHNHVSWCVYADPNLSAVDINHGNPDILADLNLVP
jgi:hypothetical protein